MPVLFTFLVCCLVGTLVAHQPDIDINRIKLSSNDQPSQPHYYPYSGKNLVGPQKRSNDYDYYSSRLAKPRKTVRYVHDATEITDSKDVKMHPPREDPRLFYQSDAYIQEVNRKNMNNEVSAIYPGTDVIRASEVNNYRSLPIISGDQRYNRIDTGRPCVRCPYDRTLIAKPGSDRVMLQYPQILTCSGQKPPRGVRFETVYGPKFGSLLYKGSHVIIGRISYGNKIVQMCKLQVNVIVQNCSVPSYLVSQCDEKGKLCSFSCRDPNLELHGQTALSCGDTMGWEGWTGMLPVCRARTWCKPPPPPEHGRVSCKGSTEANGGLAEGSTCRVHCARGYRWSPRAAAACRRGAWTSTLTCQPRIPVRQYT